MNDKIYGYDFVDGKYVINEIEAEIVKWMSSTILSYIEHPPKVLVDAVLYRWKELYKEEISYEDAEKAVSYGSILEYLTDEINHKHLLYNLSEAEKTVDGLKAILALPIEDVKEKLKGVEVPQEQLPCWEKRIIEMSQNPIYVGTAPASKGRTAKNRAHQAIVPTFLYDRVQEKRFGNAPSGHEPIIPESLFDKVQEKRFGNSTFEEQKAEAKKLAEDKGMTVMDSPEDIARAGGAICDLCGQRMLIADGCSCRQIKCNGVVYDRIRFGDEEYDMGDNCCHDCGARPGHFHHGGCDAEECPVCGGQLIGCNCEIEFITED